MQRREFIYLLGGAVVTPFTALAQKSERMRRIGVLLPATANDLEFQARVGAFMQELQRLGWSIGRNLRVDTRWATADAVEIRKHAAELAAIAPDVVVAHGASTVRQLMQSTRTVSIVFPAVSDPVGAGFVDMRGANSLSNCSHFPPMLYSYVTPSPPQCNPQIGDWWSRGAHSQLSIAI